MPISSSQEASDQRCRAGKTSSSRASAGASAGTAVRMIIGVP